LGGQVDTTLFVGLIGGFNIDLRDWYFAGAVFSEYPERAKVISTRHPRIR
jgi:hypothetical protein